jgi:hypothetical protein
LLSLLCNLEGAGLDNPYAGDVGMLGISEETVNRHMMRTDWEEVDWESRNK